MNAQLVLSDEDFRWVQAEAHRRIGIHIPAEKRELVTNRLAPVLRRQGLKTIEAYQQSLVSGGPSEGEAFISALTTNVTTLFREVHHFEHLDRHFTKRAQGQREIRLWSAGCSSGEEPASIAATLGESFNWRLLATDVDTDILRRARAFTFAVPDRWPRTEWRRAFQKGIGPNQGSMRLRPTLCRRIAVKKLNLSEPWPKLPALDAIFCRNVLIYFEPRDQMHLVSQFLNALVPGGLLYLGHSEARLGTGAGATAVGPTVFRKPTA